MLNNIDVLYKSFELIGDMETENPTISNQIQFRVQTEEE